MYRSYLKGRGSCSVLEEEDGEDVDVEGKDETGDEGGSGNEKDSGPIKGLRWKKCVSQVKIIVSLLVPVWGMRPGFHVLMHVHRLKSL